MLCEFDYLEPTTLADVLEILGQGDAGVRILAGGTDLLVNIRAGLITPKALVNIKKTAGLDTFAFHPDRGLEIGPAVTINQLITNTEIARRYPLLEQCAEMLASYQLRNRATVIGNIVNASPSADMAPALLCYRAKLTLTSKRGSRKVGIAEFFTGVKKTVLAADEIVEKITIPASEADGKGGYAKLKRIKGHDLGIVGVALHKKQDYIRIAVSASAPTPILAPDFQAKDSPDYIAEQVLAAIKPIDDIRSSREYRRFMASVFVKRLLEEVRA
ncbi:MAG: FAD binding domain-containing protein [Spirochaetota bacterium]|jgi:carbon-monoxide dehydrogenase medium subunit|nr:FAD binding domain-containing protein [Spirochaetota bacterium]